jgi:hypothetical protein
VPFYAFLRALLVTGFLSCGVTSTHAAPPDLPTEIDTIVARRTVVLTDIQGEILRKLDGGTLVTVANGESVHPGETLLVRRGASFKIGNDTIGAEAHGDRWIKFE